MASNKSNIYQLNNIFRSGSGNLSYNANQYTGYSTLEEFLNNVDTYGVQVANNFEVTFSGVDGIKFFVSGFELPGSKQNTCEIFYDGIKMIIPVNYDHEHEFSMTVINDANGLLYTAFKTYIELDSYNHYSDSGQTLLIKALTGQVYVDGGMPYAGARILCEGVRFTSISGLQYGQSNNEIQTFTLQGTLISYSHLPTDLSQY